MKATYRPSLYDERDGYGFKNMKINFVWVGNKSDVADIEVSFFTETLESSKDTDVFLVATKYVKVMLLTDLIYAQIFLFFNAIVVG